MPVAYARSWHCPWPLKSAYLTLMAKIQMFHVRGGSCKRQNWTCGCATSQKGEVKEKSTRRSTEKHVVLAPERVCMSGVSDMSCCPERPRRYHAYAVSYTRNINSFSRCNPRKARDLSAETDGYFRPLQPITGSGLDYGA